MRFDIRIPIGLLFSLIGLLLLSQGLLEADAPRTHVAGMNINAGWGAVLVMFGIGMLWLARRHARALRDRPDKPTAGPA